MVVLVVVVGVHWLEINNLKFYAENGVWLVGSGSELVPIELAAFPTVSFWVGSADEK